MELGIFEISALAPTVGPDLRNVRKLQIVRRKATMHHLERAAARVPPFGAHGQRASGVSAASLR
jgi:hypothetical protein